MTQITVRDAVERELSEAAGTVEVRGASGRVLGVFIPSHVQDRPPLDDPEVDEAELRRRFAQGGGRPLREILAELERAS